VAKSKNDAQQEVLIEELKTGQASVQIIGTSPLICNAMSAKARHELLMPKGRKTAADKAQTLKHNPPQEFIDSCYRRIGKGPTRIIFPAAAVKSAICNAALEVQGAKKAQIGRLVWVEGDYLDIYGVPELLMRITRSADMNKTPDVRTRAILRQWTCSVKLNFVEPTMNAVSLCRLLETAGLVIGIGDFRQEKGKGNYGQFRTCDTLKAKPIMAAGGMVAQDKAFADPTCYDAESESLLAWFHEEVIRRGKTKQQKAK